MENYKLIINKAIDYIEENISEVISLSEISSALEISKYHFHKIFKLITGETVAEFIKRIRLEKGADMLIRTTSPITVITFETGFSSVSVFSREFKKRFGITPRSFRFFFSCYKKSNDFNSAEINSFQDKIHLKKLIKLNNVSPCKDVLFLDSLSFKIESLPEYLVIYMRYIGDYSDLKSIFSLWINLKNIVVSHSLSIDNLNRFSIIYDNPYICASDKCRYDACFSISEPKVLSLIKDKVGYRTISEGKYAVFNFKGNIDKLFQTYTAIDKSWFENTGYEPDNKPSYFRHSLKEDYTNIMEFEICIPVKKSSY